MAALKGKCRNEGMTGEERMLSPLSMQEVGRGEQKR
jgi:hypothetical protein